MRILLLHNRYQQAGGEDQVVQAERALLESQGHEVALLEANNKELVTPSSKARAGLGAVYSYPSRWRIGQEIRRFEPDVVHVHNFFPLLSPSVYDACRKAGVPVVQTLHNFRLTCSNAVLFRQGRICEDCVGKSLPWLGVVRGCYRGSRLQSAAVAMMIAAHRLRRTWLERVDAFIAMTQFQREVLIRAGLPADKLHVKPHFLPDPGLDPGPRHPGDYALFVGRLSEEKGLNTVIEAYRAGRLELPLVIVGDGPLRQLLEVQAKGLEAITFLGRRPHHEVLELMRRARVLVFPSACYEAFGLTIIEAFALGLPVVASRLGGVPELIGEHERGWLVDPVDPVDWARALQEAAGDSGAWAQKSAAARRAYEEHFGPLENYRLLLAIYQEALEASIRSAEQADTGSVTRSFVERA